MAGLTGVISPPMNAATGNYSDNAICLWSLGVGGQQQQQQQQGEGGGRTTVLTTDKILLEGRQDVRCPYDYIKVVSGKYYTSEKSVLYELHTPHEANFPTQ